MDSSSKDEAEQLIVFTVDQEEYAVPISDIREVLDASETTPVPDSLPYVLGIMNLRGRVVPILDLEKRLNLRRENEMANRHILVTDYDNNVVGVRVDQVKEVLKVSKENIQPTPAMITSKISPEFLQGVVVITKTPPDSSQESTDPDQTQSEQVKTDSRVLLLLKLQKIISPDELKNVYQSVAPAAGTKPQPLDTKEGVTE